MSRTPKKDLLAELKIGDLCQYGSSQDAFYEVVALHHPDSSRELSLRSYYHGINTREVPFGYSRASFNKDFTQIYRTAQDRELAKLAHQLKRACVSAGVGEVQDLLVRLEV